MRAIVLAALCGSGVFSWTAVAATETTTTAAPAAVSEGNSTVELGVRPRKFEEDKRITDLELKAQSGSLSRYSLKFSLGYNGSPVNQLADPNRPNPDGRSGDNRTNLSGNVGLRFRVNSDTAVNVGTGVLWYTPYQAVINEKVDRPKNSKTYDISDPGIGADHSYLIGGVQSRSSIFVSDVTNDYYSSRGQVATINVGQAAKWVVARSRVTLGAQISANYFAFDRAYRVGTGPRRVGGDGNVSKYNFNLIPSVEYKIVDNLNFNTSLGYPYQNLRSESSWANWRHQLSTWRVGLGWAIRRDIYFNPYVNFFAEAPAFNTASLNFNTVFSIF